MYRLITVILFGIMIPIVLFFCFFWKLSLREIERINDAFYENSLETYVDLFDRKVEDLETFASRISAESKDTDCWLWNGSDALDQNIYQVYMAIRELEEKYRRNDVTEWGIYFYDIDKIITSKYAYSSEQFIYKYTGMNKEFTSCADFFSEENYSLFHTVFDTTNRYGEYSGCLLLGVCTRIGQNNDHALVFYVISPDDINNSLAIVGGEGIAYWLKDGVNGENLLVWGDISEKDRKDALSAERGESHQTVLYHLDSLSSKLSISAYISDDSLRNNVLDWALHMRLIFVGIATVLVVICLVAVYLFYKPVHELVSKLDDFEGSEFEAIHHVLDDKDCRIGEQEMLIMDLLLNHMIFGVPISKERIKCLGIEEDMYYYCVFLFEGYYFVNSEAEKLTEEIEREGKIRIFVTDLQEENCSVLIVFSKEKTMDGLRARLDKWLAENYVDPDILYEGKVFDKIDNIQLSFRSCLDKMKKKNEKKVKLKTRADAQAAKEEMQKKLKEDILTYLEINYRDSNLNQMQVADVFGISNYTLSRLFKNQVGVGFTEYLVAKRLDYAKELLLTTSYSVREIAIMAGFSSEAYFSRTFKLYEEVSPSAFRIQ